MAILKINNVDVSGLVSGLKVGYETLVSETSGRNAAGDMIIDTKSLNVKRKLYVTLRHTTFAEMQTFLGAISNFTVSVSYLDPRNNLMQTMSAYTGTPEPEYFNVSKTIFKPLNLNFIEL